MIQFTNLNWIQRDSMWFLNRTAKPARPPGLGEFTKVLFKTCKVKIGRDGDTSMVSVFMNSACELSILLSFQPVGPSASSQNKILRSYAKRHPLWVGWLWQPSQLVGPTASVDVKQNCTVSPHINIQARWCKGSTIFGNTQASTARCESVISYCYNCQCLCTTFCCRCVTIPSPTCTASHRTPSSWDAQFRLGHLWCVWAWSLEQFGKLLPKLVTLYFHIWTVFGFCCIFCPSYWDDFVGIKKTTVLVASWGALPSELPTESNPEMDEVHPIGSMVDVSCEEVGVQKNPLKMANLWVTFATKGSWCSTCALTVMSKKRHPSANSQPPHA